MKRFRLAGFVIAVMAFGIIARTGAQVADRAEVLLQAARTKQVVERRLEEAIEIYQQVVKQSGSNRGVAGKALLGMAQSYEKLGRSEARDTYAQLVKDYGDQPNVAREARVRLATFAPAKAQTASLTPRRMITTDSVRVSSISRDGRLGVALSGSDPREDLVLVEMTSGRSTRLVAGSGAEVFSTPVLSPDGRQVAYGTVARAPGNSPRAVALRVIGTQSGATARTLMSRPSGQTFVPSSWSPDSTSILVTRGTALNAGGPRQLGASQMTWVSAADGTERVIKTFDADGAPGQATVSPDGRWIAYVIGQPQRPMHIHLLDSEGRSESTVVKLPGVNTRPIWTSDSAHLLFTHSQLGANGTWALWSVALQNGTTSGEPWVVSADFQGNPLGVSSAGALYLARSEARTRTVFVAERLPSGAQVIQTFAGQVPTLSPDGKSVVFLDYQGRVGLSIRSVETGDHRFYPHEGLDLDSPQWLPDATGLIVYVSPAGDGGGRPGGSFYRLDTKTGTFTWLFARHTETHARSTATALSPDGRTLYLAARPLSQTDRWTAIVAVDLNSGIERSIATFPGDGLVAFGPNLRGLSGLALSPDGGTVALQHESRTTRGLEARLFTVRVDGTAYHELLGPFPRAAMAPQWTPDGRALLFATTTEQGVWRVMRVSATGGAVEFDSVDLSRLTGSIPLPRISPGIGDGISLSRDGSRIAFTATLLPVQEIWTLENVMAVLNARR